MKTPNETELAWAAIEACSIATLLDRLTPEESGLSGYELCLARAHAWALADGLRLFMAGALAAQADAQGVMGRATPGSEGVVG